MEKTTVWIAMGSNIGERRATLQEAIAQMQACGVAVTRVSHTYETEPVGFVSEDRFMNAVAEAEWPGSAEALLAELMRIETALGRTRSGLQGYTSRTVDLDIVLFGKEVINTAELVVPHPRMAERRFVLEPLNELIPNYIHPVLKTQIRQLLERCIDETPQFVQHKPLSVNP